MYKITADGTAAYSDGLVYIKLHRNGCYIPCSEDEAEGVCGKVAESYTNEDGTSGIRLTDKVYRLKSDGLNGTEPECSVEKSDGALELANATAAVDELILSTLGA